MAQVGSRGGRISILGLWSPQVSFEYALVQGGFKTERYIKTVTSDQLPVTKFQA